MLAPEPFFEPRGTPFSEFHRLKALTEQGHSVDLVTYPFGADVDMPNLRIIRAGRPPFVQGVRIGPSVAKAFLDVWLTVAALRQARAGRYDVVHSHEEAGLLGVWLARRLGIPHLYDMHSSLPQQLENFKFSSSGLLRWLFETAERRMIHDSKVVITICQELQDTVTAMGAGDRAVLIENVMGGDVDGAPGPGRPELRRAHGLTPEDAVVLYTGTFEAYQGLDLLFDAMERLRDSHPRAVALVVGGTPSQVDAARTRVGRSRARVVFTGQRPPAEIPHFVDACDVLASPRISGTNTPLKIYSYLRSGRPVVATRLLTHLQVLDDTSAVLVEPSGEAFAEGLSRVLDQPHLAARVVQGAQALAASKYSRATYLEKTRQAYAMLLDGSVLTARRGSEAPA